MKISAWWILAAVVITLAAVLIFNKFFYIPSETVNISSRRNYDVITLALPKETDPSVFGPKYWESFHKITENIPCPDCRSKAVPFMKFFHDVVNKKTGKPIFDRDNFNNHLDMICKMEKA